MVAMALSVAGMEGVNVSGAAPSCISWSYALITLNVYDDSPSLYPSTRASVGAFHAHEGDDGEEEGDEKEAVKKFCVSGCRFPKDTLWKTYQ